MRTSLSIVSVLALVIGVSPTLYAVKTPEEIRAAIEAGVGHLIDLQQEDGSWKEPDVTHGGTGYDVGRTALATLALLNARPYVSTDRIEPAIHKGLTFIVQQWPEAKTYTDGLVEQALVQADPTRYRKMIFGYAWMLAMSQAATGPQVGAFSYGLVPFPKDFGVNQNYDRLRGSVSGRADNSNTQFGVLGMLYAAKAGVQIPKVCWLRLLKYYEDAQHQDGGWDYQSDRYRQSIGQAAGARLTSPSTFNMTLAGTVSTYIANEMLYAESHDQCRPQRDTEPVDRGLDWIAKHWNTGLQPYGWYACERLGMLTGYSEFGGNDWYEAGAEKLCGPVASGTIDGFGGNMPSLCFGILFLSRGMSPVIINKLRRQGDWDLHLHDIAHVTDYISDKFQYAKQWRIVTLNASTDYLLRVPILWISGHEKLQFTDEDKKKLKEYVERGGTILAEACCSKHAFDQSFRSLMAELWPDAALQPLPSTHQIYDMPRPLKELRPEILGLAIKANQGRLGVIYLPHGISCQWERGGSEAVPALDVAANIYFYVEKYANRGKTPAELERERIASHDGSEASPVPKYDGADVPHVDPQVQAPRP